MAKKTVGRYSGKVQKERFESIDLQGDEQMG